MSLRKYMHPRNKYRKIPDFKQLAIFYPEFRRIAITDLSGKVRIDFKQEESLRILTKTLLKHDFFLDVEIPKNKLVPTLPLRLNYVLWIEDLMQHAGYNEMALVKGVDIGTGAVCIYPLLLAKIYGCSVIATEVNADSVHSATENVQRNNLSHLIKVLTVKDDNILKNNIEGEEDLHFTMCNPPFFESEQCAAKTEKRLPPRNAPTGDVGELKAEGGEKSFVIKLIRESMDIRNRIKIYSTMLGCKTNLVLLVKFLRRNNVTNTVWTEFCQGHTTRWGLAWTFLSKEFVDLSKAPVIRKGGDFILKSLKDECPVNILCPVQDEFSSIEKIIAFLKLWINELSIEGSRLHVNDSEPCKWMCRLTATSDTWIHARRKRRLAQREKNCHDQNTNRSVDTQDNLLVSGIDSPSGEASVSAGCTDGEPHLVCDLSVEILENKDLCRKDLNICMAYVKGSGGKNSMEGLKQHLLNKLNVRQYLQGSHSKTNSKRKRKKGNEKSSKCMTSDEECQESYHLAIKAKESLDKDALV